MNTHAGIILIAAVAQNGAIGLDNALPWRLRADLLRFKALTSGHPIIMGRKTWESLGRPLPNRRNIVITRNPDYVANGAEVFTTSQAALDASTNPTDPVFVIGGAELYGQLIATADRLLITEVHANIDGDAFFPAIDPDTFVEVSRESHPADSDNEYPFDFVEYRRRG